MSAYNDEEGIKGQERCTLPSGVLHGFVCPVCVSIYETEELALQCMKAHDEIAIKDFIFSTGEVFPLEILLERKEGKEVTEIATYKRVQVDKIGDKNVSQS